VTLAFTSPLTRHPSAPLLPPDILFCPAVHSTLMSLATSKLSMLSLPPEIIREIDATLYLPMHKQPSTLTLLDGSVPSMPNKEGQHQEQRKELSDLVSFASTCKRIRCSLAPQLFHGMRLWQWEKVKLLNEAWWLTYIR